MFNRDEPVLLLSRRQRELDHSQTEVSGDETVDDELQQLAELEEGEEADSLLASRTDDDLILEMEEFM